MDVAIFRFINDGIKNPVFDVLFALLSFSGLGATAAIIAIALVFNPRTRKVAVGIGMSALIGGTILAQSFKSAIPRERPSRQSYAHVMEPIYHASFPSGHTATAFAVATVLATLAFRSNRKGLAILAFVWAFLVGISRIYRGVHWPTDVTGGALAGIFGGCITMLFLDQLFTKKSGQSSLSAPEESQS